MCRLTQETVRPDEDDKKSSSTNTDVVVLDMDMGIDIDIVANNDEDDSVLVRDVSDDAQEENEEYDHEREVWETMVPSAWHDSINRADSIFLDTYRITRHVLRETAIRGGYDVIVEVGCGTGDIIGQLNSPPSTTTTSSTTSTTQPPSKKNTASSSSSSSSSTTTPPPPAVIVPCIGIDINKDFLDFCQKTYQQQPPKQQQQQQSSSHQDEENNKNTINNNTVNNSHAKDGTNITTSTTTTDATNTQSGCEFFLADALHLVEWYEAKGYRRLYQKPLVICVNNTLNIMPQAMRGAVVDQMLGVAGRTGSCMVSYWNGNFFSHAVMNYYKNNAPLCGDFEVHAHVNWDDRILVTPTNYSTHWQTPSEVQLLLRSYDVDVSTMVGGGRPPLYGQPHIHCDGLAIFVWFDSTSTSHAKGYYDSDDAQTFYQQIWGENELHVGRFDLLTPQEVETLTLGEQIRRAEELHELELVRLIKSHTPGADHSLRIVDLGCGYGGLLRRLWDMGLVWKGIGCDISHRMCVQARTRNRAAGAHQDIDILEESYLQLSVPNESADLVLSMDALLHVGPDRQRQVMKEAGRILRPGGWIIFSDIMQEEIVDAELMQPIYDRINLSKMGTIQNYHDALTECGFANFSTELHSHNIPIQYGKILTELEQRGDEIGLSKLYQDKAKRGLQVWRDNSPGNIVWGFIAAQKTKKVA
jgi:sarcosine/dimethylglycine N-methyltransferase